MSAMCWCGCGDERNQFILIWVNLCTFHIMLLVLLASWGFSPRFHMFHILFCKQFAFYWVFLHNFSCIIQERCLFDASAFRMRCILISLFDVGRKFRNMLELNHFFNRHTLGGLQLEWKSWDITTINLKWTGNSWEVWLVSWKDITF